MAEAQHDEACRPLLGCDELPWHEGRESCEPGGAITALAHSQLPGASKALHLALFTTNYEPWGGLCGGV